MPRMSARTEEMRNKMTVMATKENGTATAGRTQTKDQEQADLKVGVQDRTGAKRKTGAPAQATPEVRGILVNGSPTRQIGAITTRLKPIATANQVDPDKVEQRSRPHHLNNHKSS